jgi:hypothetical protein
LAALGVSWLLFTAFVSLQEVLKEMREELNDALNEVALVTRIRNEEKRISSERYMQLRAAASQLEEGWKLPEL